MPLAEGVASSIRSKPYATGVITSNAQAVSTTDPAASGGQILRRVSSSLKLAKDTYQSAEIRTDRQIQDYRHGVKRVTGSLSGEFSPKTYFELLEAAFRATKAAGLSLSNTDFTSITSDQATSSFTVTSGNPVTSGLRIGDIFRPGGLAAAANNATNFLITGFTTVNNRQINVSPPPVTDAVADATFTLTSNGTTGKSIFVPSSVFVSRKFAFEIYNSGLDVSRLFTECRIGGFTIQLPATGNGTIEVPVMGRDMETYTGAAAPFFTAPASETTTGVFAAVNGLLRVAGVTVGVVTGLNVQMDLKPESSAVVGQNFVPEIFLGRANVTGQVTAFFEDLTLINQFKNETEVSILAYLTTTSVQPAPALSIYLPRIKWGDGSVADQGEGGQSITLPFQALKADGTVPGDEATSIRIVDTEAV
jgi:hypothetical protein